LIGFLQQVHGVLAGSISRFSSKFSEISGGRTIEWSMDGIVVRNHHLFAQYAEMNSKICNVPDRKANSFSFNNCPYKQNCNNKNTTIKTQTSQLK